MEMIKKPILQMLVGLPGSGKSTYAARRHEICGIHVCSSDEIRAELGDVNCQDNNEQVFRILHRRIKEYLQNGESVIYDATNISSKRRRAFLLELKNIDCQKHCIIFRTRYERCLEQNNLRERKVPPEVIREMYMKWDTPHYFEGWDNIFIWENLDDYEIWSSRRPNDFITETCNYDQRNPHHSLTLGNHCLKTAGMFEDDPILRYAAMIHDCGKPFCKTYRNARGVVTKQAHYYNHEHVGAYEALFYCFPGVLGTLTISTLVNLHMQPYFWEIAKDEEFAFKAREKYRRIWGDELFEMVMRLHEADKAAH